MPRGSSPPKVFHITAKLLLGIIQDAMATMGKAYPEIDVVDFMICFAASVGNFEGKPMNQTKLAAFSGIPRPTVVRRVKRLVAYQLLELSADGKFIITGRTRFVGDGAESLSARYIGHIQKAAAELSKLDT